MSNFRFHSICLEQIDIILPNFMYAFKLTRSSLGLLPAISFWFMSEFRVRSIYLEKMDTFDQTLHKP